jgi:hypothetical protein
MQIRPPGVQVFFHFRPPVSGRYFLSCSLLLAAIPALATDYYVSPSGNDKKGNGTAAKPWKTIAEVNQHQYLPGDRILFQGGASYSGTLNFTSRSRGTAASPIMVTSYGAGRATIAPGTAAALFAYNTAGYVLSNLDFVGSGASNTAHGVNFYADLAGGVKLDTIVIDSVEVRGFGKAGIIIGSWNGVTGFQNVRITNTSSHDNADGGISTYGDVNINTVGWPHRNVYIGNCTAYNNMGRAGTTTASGNGIVVGAADGVIIERSLAYNNGVNNTNNGGPVGIWVYDSNNALIQYNESHHNHTNSVTDGGGFDIDGGTTNSVMQYNYSHDNEGPGYALIQYAGARVWANNTARYNVSQNDARKNGVGAIHFWNGGSGVQSAQVYNNTVYISGTAPMPRAMMFQTPTSNVSVRNNIFFSTGGAPVLDAVGGQYNLSLQGNNWWSGGAATTFVWNYASYGDLGSFRSSTGMETFNGSPVGMSLDPRLTAPGAGPSINNPAALSTLSAYRLQGGSPMIDTGLTLGSLFGVNPGPSDLYGSPLPRGLAYDVGANEY